MRTVSFISVVFLLLLTACVQERVEPLSAEMKHQLALLPQQADVMGYVDLQQIRQSEVAKTFLDSTATGMLRNHEFKEFQELTGFDFRKDAKAIYFAAGLNKDEKDKNVLFAVLGNFDPDKIIGFISSKDDKKVLSEESYLKYTVYHVSDNHLAFCFADPTTLVVGNVDAVKSWLDKSQSASEANLSAEWLQRIEPLKYKNGLWMAMTTQKFIDMLDKNTPLPGNFQGIKAIKNGSISMDFSDQLSFYGQGECTDPDKALLFHDTIKGILASAKLAVSDQRDLIDIINKVSVAAKKELVTVQFKMTADEINKLLNVRKWHKKST